jgi:capsule polysaccharide export protein KpsE/RkpR
MTEWSSVATDRGTSEQRLAHRIATLELLFRRRSFLLRAVVLGAAIFSVIAFLIPKRYQSTARIMPPDNSAAASLAGRLANLGGLAELAPQLSMKDNSAMFVAVLNSRTMADLLIDQFDLRKVYGVPLYATARKKLAKNTSVSEDRISGVITITVTDRDPKRAAALATSYVDHLNSMVAELSTSAARRERIFLEGRLKDVQQEWENAAQELGQFSSKNATLDMATQGRATVDAATSLESQLIAAQAELQGLKQIYSEDNARVRSVQARVDELQSKVGQLVGRPEASGTATVSSGNPGAIPSLRSLPLLGATYGDLYSKASVDEAVFVLLRQQYELAKVEEAREIPTVKVLDDPDVPEKKSFPPRVLIVAVGTFATCLFAASWVLIDSAWSGLEKEDPRRIFAQRIINDVRRSKLR